MKKIIALLLVLALTLSLAACGGSGSTATEAPKTDAPAEAPKAEAPAAAEAVDLDVVIAQYGSHTAEWWKEFEATFEEANQDINLNVEIISWNDITAQISSRIQTGEQPDILNISPFSTYVGDDLLVPAEDYVSETVKNNIIPSFYEANTVDGTVWALPILASVRCMLVNTDILAQAGVEKIPTTWDEILEACEAVKQNCPGITPWGLDISTDEGQAAFSYYSWNFGGGYVDENNDWALNSEENVKALEFINTLYNSGYCNANPTTDTRYPLQDAFSAGKMAMLLAPMNAVSSDSTINFEFAPFPTSSADVAPASMGVSDQFMVFRKDDSKNEEARLAACTKFFDAFYELETYADYMVFEGFLPATLDAGEYLATNADKHTNGNGAAGDNDYFALFCPMAAGAKFYPEAKLEWVDVKFGVIDAEQQVCEGLTTAQEALDALQAEIAG